MSNSLLTVADASRILHLVPATVRLLADSGKLPVMRTESGMRLFCRQDVERLAAERNAKRGQLRNDSLPSDRQVAAEEGGHGAD
jgi:hypothetical protein